MNKMCNIYYTNNISWTLLGDEVFIFNEITNEIFLLKDLMKDFWLTIQGTQNFNEILNILKIKYENDSHFDEEVIFNKIKNLSNNKLIIVRK